MRARVSEHGRELGMELAEEEEAREKRNKGTWLIRGGRIEQRERERDRTRSVDRK